MSDRPPRVLFVASEVVGFAKTGGLADVAGSLPRALAKRGIECAVVLPLYHAVRTGGHDLTPTDVRFSVPLGGRTVTGRLWRTTLPGVRRAGRTSSSRPNCSSATTRTRAGASTSSHGADGRKHDYADNADRFIVFCRAVMDALPRLGTALRRAALQRLADRPVAVLPARILRPAEPLQRPRLRRPAHAVHDPQHRLPGSVSGGRSCRTPASHRRLFNHRQLEFYGQLNFLKAGCVFADRLSTVSPRYAEEIQTMVFGCGLEGVLTERHNVLSGIVNGVDYDVWNPATDPHLAATYDVDTIFDRKPASKLALQAEFGLPQRPDVPLLGMVARLVEQKGCRLVVQSAHELLSHDIQIVILGEGDPTHPQATRRDPRPLPAEARPADRLRRGAGPSGRGAGPTRS